MSLSLSACQRQAMIVVIVVMINGCGAMSGGATYRVSYQTPDGALITAHIDVVSESDSVEAEFVRDQNGVKLVRFSKQGTRQAERSMMDLLQQQTQLLESVINRAPLPGIP